MSPDLQNANLKLFTLSAVLLAGSLVGGCDRPKPEATQAEVKSAGATAPGAELSGKQLVDLHCVRCHLAPDPADLAKEYWPYALHYMGNYVGMKGDEFDDMRVEPFPPELEPVQDYTKRYFLYDNNGFFRDFYPFKEHIPPQPEMSKEEFQRMRDYFAQLQTHLRSGLAALTPIELVDHAPLGYVVKTYNEAIALCVKLKEAGSRELMERMVVESEESIDWGEAQLDLIRMTGIENYLAQQIGEGEGD